MNTVKYEKVNDTVQAIFFENGSHEMGFGIEKGSAVVFVWESHKIGIDMLAKPSDLPLQWLLKVLETNIGLLKDDEKFGLGTPLGSIFGFSKRDLQDLLNFLKANR